MRVAFIVIVSLCFLSCNTDKKEDRPLSLEKSVPVIPPMIIQNDPQFGSIDISLHIQTIRLISTGIKRYTLLSTYQGEVVGFIIDMREKQSEAGAWNGIVFRSMGDTSNHFISALAKVYGIKKQDIEFVDSVQVTYIDLAGLYGEKKEGDWIAAQIKLFFNTEDNSTEWLMNIDEQRQTIDFPEKGSEYREGIVEALSKKKK
jgi:hypothetical protein